MHPSPRPAITHRLNEIVCMQIISAFFKYEREANPDLRVRLRTRGTTCGVRPPSAERPVWHDSSFGSDSASKRNFNINGSKDSDPS